MSTFYVGNTGPKVDLSTLETFASNVQGQGAAHLEKLDQTERKLLNFCLDVIKGKEEFDSSKFQKLGGADTLHTIEKVLRGQSNRTQNAKIGLLAARNLQNSSLADSLESTFKHLETKELKEKASTTVTGAMVVISDLLKKNREFRSELKIFQEQNPGKTNPELEEKIKLSFDALNSRGELIKNLQTAIEEGDVNKIKESEQKLKKGLEAVIDFLSPKEVQKERLLGKIEAARLELNTLVNTKASPGKELDHEVAVADKRTELKRLEDRLKTYEPLEVDTPSSASSASSAASSAEDLTAKKEEVSPLRKEIDDLTKKETELQKEVDFLKLVKSKGEEIAQQLVDLQKEKGELRNDPTTFEFTGYFPQDGERLKDKLLDALADSSPEFSKFTTRMDQMIPVPLDLEVIKERRETERTKFETELQAKEADLAKVQSDLASAVRLAELQENEAKVTRSEAAGEKLRNLNKMQAEENK